MSDFDLSGFPWREPLQPDWTTEMADLAARLAGLPTLGEDAARDVAAKARRLAAQRLGPLQQVKTNRLAARLWPQRDHLPALRALRVALLSNRTVSFLAQDLGGAGLARGLLINVVEGPFNTVEAVASGGLRLTLDGPLDATILMLDTDAFFADGLPLTRDAERMATESMRQRLATLVAGLRQHLQAPVIVATTPPGPDQLIASADSIIFGSRSRLTRQLNDAITAGAEAGDWLAWNLEALASQVGTFKWIDPGRYHQTKAPFALELSPLAADHLCRVLAALTGRSGRVLVMDLDNTLWGGVIGDDGVEGIRLGQGSPEGEAFVAMQRLALTLRARGILLAVCSKNNDDVARRAFNDHPDMLLKLDQLAVFQANWSDKATNVRAIASTLNLGLGALVFVDDNPAERARVRQELPEVLVPELGDDPAWYPRMITASGYFESLALGAEDLGRADAYQTNAARAELLSSIGNYKEYLGSLQMKLTVAPFDRIGRSRIVQLIAKSNQFNLTTRRYNEIEVADMESDASVVAWQARLTDRFGDHGMIAVVIARMTSAEVWTIDSWLMSCRVLERGVEHALMNTLAARALSAGCLEIRGIYRPTERNQIVADFFDRMGFQMVNADENGLKLYSLSLIGFKPFDIEIAVEMETRFSE